MFFDIGTRLGETRGIVEFAKWRRTFSGSLLTRYDSFKLLTKGGVAMPGASKILALPEKGGGGV